MNYTYECHTGSCDECDSVLSCDCECHEEYWNTYSTHDVEVSK